MILQPTIQLLWRWAWLIVLSAIIAGAGAFFLSQRMAPIYTASTTLLINQAPVTSVALDLDSLRASTSLARTYVELMRKRPVLEAVIDTLALDLNASELAGMVTIALVPNTQLILLTVEDTDPVRAADIANEIVNAFTLQNQERQAQRYASPKQGLEQELNRIQQEINNVQDALEALAGATGANAVVQQNQLQALMAQHSNSYATVFNSLETVRLAEAQATNNLEVVEAARPERSPKLPKPWQNSALAAMLGGALAIGLVILLDYLDQSVRSAKEVEEWLGMTTLATIGRLKGATLPEKLAIITRPNSSVAEDYRLLRANIEFAVVDRALRTLVVTSSDSSEGKSTTITNLAIALAQTGKRVILVDANLRQPTLHKFFNQTNIPGVTTRLLQGERPATDYLAPTGVKELHLLASGPHCSNPAELLGSRTMVDLIEELKAHADLVLFDTPPLLAAVDALLLARSCDATLFVVRAGVTRVETLQRAKEQVTQAGANILGVVLNQVTTSYRSYTKIHYQEEKPHYQPPPKVEPQLLAAAYNEFVLFNKNHYKLYPDLDQKKPKSSAPTDDTP